MEHDEQVALIRNGISGRAWAELGSGRGAFILALAEVLGPGGRIYSVDRDPSALRTQQSLMQARFPDAAITYLHADFTRPLDLPQLDGILIANALHFVPYPQQVKVVARFRNYLRPGGHLVLVEYDVACGNMWVPHPFRYERWKEMAEQAGFAQTRQLAYRAGSFLNGMYSAVCVNTMPEQPPEFSPA
jgi:ubiquinone/menaquinone biosynthesis C-methylase UbiE